MKKIIIGNSGTGKSKRCFEIAKEYSGTVIYIDGIPKGDEYYEKYGLIKDFSVEHFGKTVRMQNNKKYFISSDRDTGIYKNWYKLSLESVISLFAHSEKNDYVRDITNSILLIIDDGYWEQDQNGDKAMYLWQLSHSNRDIIITVSEAHGLVNANLTKDMINDLSKYWEIEFMKSE